MISGQVDAGNRGEVRSILQGCRDILDTVGRQVAEGRHRHVITQNEITVKSLM